MIINLSIPDVPHNPKNRTCVSNDKIHDDCNTTLVISCRNVISAAKAHAKTGKFHASKEEFHALAGSYMTKQRRVLYFEGYYPNMYKSIAKFNAHHK